MKKNILLLFLTLSLCSFSVHKYYVALTEINYNTKSKSVQMIMNVFVDDIELALNNDYNINAKLNTPQELKNINDYFNKYLSKHFKILINGELKPYNFIGKEYDGDIVFFYLEIENITNLKSIEIKNTVLTQYFSEQRNLVKIKAGNKRESFFLSKEKYKGLLKF